MKKFYSVISIVVLCLLPLQNRVEAASAAASATADGAAAQPGELDKLKHLFGGSDRQPELLPPEQAFAVKVGVKDANTVIAEFKPADGYYLYRDRISFNIEDPAAIQIAEVVLPKGEAKEDPTFGKVAVFHTAFQAIIRLKRTVDTVSNVRLHFRYQGCADIGVCYPPIDKTFDVTLPALSAASADGAVATIAAAPAIGWFDGDRSAALFQAKNFGWVIAGFFGFGLLLSLTPCVWPLFPILSGIIAGQGASVTKLRAFGLSACYVLGVAVTYSAMGVAAGLSGSLLSTALQTPWAVAAMAALFVVLALSTFGLYELQLPAFLQSRIAAAGSGSGKRTVVSVFGMGVVSAIIIGPCIAAPLAAALLYIGQTKDVVLGGSALFAMALGKGVPLIAIGTSLGSLLPHAGAWMQSIKVFLGVLLLAAAIWTISPFISISISMVLAGSLLIAYAGYLFTVDVRHAGGFAGVGKGFGVIGLLLGAIYIVGAVSGSRDFFQPLAGLSRSPQQEAVAPLPFEHIVSIDELDAKLRSTKGRYVMLDLYADWCVSCKELERSTFADPTVRAKLHDVVLLRADITANSAEDKRLLARFGLFGPPGILFFDKAGQEINGRRVIGFIDADRFVDLLNEIFL